MYFPKESHAQLRHVTKVLDEAKAAMKAKEEEEDTINDWIDERDRRLDEDYDGSNDDGFDLREGVTSEEVRDLYQEQVSRCREKLTEARKAFLTFIDPYVKNEASSSVVSLYEAMRSVLPIEIRNQVYLYLGVKQPHPVSLAHERFRADFQSPDLASYLSGEHHNLHLAEDAGTYDVLKPGGWLLNPDYIGHSMAREIAEIFYAVNDFVVCVTRLPELLTTDRTQTDVRPCDLIRRKLSVSITTTYCNGGSERAWLSTANEVEFLNRVYNQLNALNLLTRKSQICLSVNIRTAPATIIRDIESERRFFNIMEAVRAPLYDQIHSGVQIRITHTSERTYKVTSISDSPMNYFTLTKEDWENEKKSHGEDWLPSENFFLREDLNDHQSEERLKELLEQRWGYLKSIYR